MRQDRKFMQVMMWRKLIIEQIVILTEDSFCHQLMSESGHLSEINAVRHDIFFSEVR